jgi:hypothetical protein
MESMIDEQIKEQFYQAFDNILTQSLSTPNPDWDWVARLYTELRDRLCQLTPRRLDIHENIKESMDVKLFNQMIRNNAFTSEDMWKLVEYVFSIIKSRQAPVRDADTETRRQTLSTEFNKEGMTIAKFLPLFLKLAHVSIDVIEEDKKEFLKQFKP